MASPRRILVPLDLQPASLRAIGPARRLADRIGVGLDIVTWSYTAWHERWSRRRIERHLARHGVEAPLEVLATGARNAGIAVAEAAAQREACVVMATHARSGAGRTILGSVGEEVLSHALQPVVFVGPRVRTWTPNGRLVLGLDGSACAEQALEPMTAWARDLGLPLELVEVTEPATPYPVRTEAPDRTYLEHIAARLPPESRVEISPLQGEAAAELARFAAEGDLLAVASHGRRGLSRVVLGSVAMRLVHHAPCPVVVVRATARVDHSRV